MALDVIQKKNIGENNNDSATFDVKSNEKTLHWRNLVHKLSVLSELTKPALGDDGLGGVGRLALAALVDGPDAELVRLILGEAVNGARLHVTGDELTLHPVGAEFLLWLERWGYCLLGVGGGFLLF